MKRWQEQLGKTAGWASQSGVLLCAAYACALKGGKDAAGSSAPLPDDDCQAKMLRLHDLLEAGHESAGGPEKYRRTFWSLSKLCEQLCMLCRIVAL